MSSVKTLLNLPVTQVRESEGDLLDDRWVTRATKTARGAVILSYLLTLIFVLVLGLERFSFTSNNEVSIEQVKRANQISSDILLEDERLTMSAYMAAATGDPIWIKRYDEQLPVMDAAIAAAIAIATPETAKQFDSDTRVSNDKLVALEKSAFTRIQVGDLNSAQAILNSASYQKHKAILAKGSAEFSEKIQASVNERLKENQRRSWWIVATLLTFGFVGFFIVWRLLTHHLRAAEATFSRKQSEIRDLALTDTLTGLANRRCFIMHLERELSRAKRESSHFAILLIDLDGFKPINDVYGHDVGDAVLKLVAAKLIENSRKSDLVVRYGGDEFVVLLPLLGSENEIEIGARTVANKLIAELSQEMKVGDKTLRIGASIGMAIAPRDGQVIDQLMRKADTGLYQVKARGGNAVHWDRNLISDPVEEFA
jgi:diguanylate cyclase (GGDEF)-like protein